MSRVVLITGSCGLIGSEAVEFFAGKHFHVVGIDNDMRKYFFGEQASTSWRRIQLEQLPNYRHTYVDVRDEKALDPIFREYGTDIELIVHAAAQPSHDWAATEPLTDFDVNARGTLLLLEKTRQHAPSACFIFTSTNKVYGDTPNGLPLEEKETRWTLKDVHPWAEFGIDETMSIDRSTHSLFGASKLAADVLVQEYGRYFGMKTVCFRGGCLTGPHHSGAQAHGFLAYLMKCAITKQTYTIFGYKGKQVRDNIHSRDLIAAFWHFFQNPRVGEVYNIGGGVYHNCSVMEGIALCEELTGANMDIRYSDVARVGDHIWWISDVRKFQSHYPDWSLATNLQQTLTEIRDAIAGRM